MTDRTLKWVSSIHPKNDRRLKALQERLAAFYKSGKYYDEIDFTAGNWADAELLHYRKVMDEISSCSKILEIGCGRAHILDYLPELEPRYTGIDISPELIGENSLRHPSSRFDILSQLESLPYDNDSFDAVFSIFVLEHTVFPYKLLLEFSRVLKQGGKLVVLTPDFLGESRMVSQISGLSPGSGREKLTKKKYFDAAVTGFDNKVRIRLYSLLKKIGSVISPQFYINLSPACFNHEFFPDADAVYVTYEPEIKRYLKEEILWVEHDETMRKYLKSIKALLLVGKKR